MALAALLVAVARLAYPPTTRRGVLAGGGTLVAAVAVAVAVSVLYEGGASPSVWLAVGGAGLGVATRSGWTYVRAITAGRQARPSQSPAIEEGSVPESVDETTVEILFQTMQKLVEAEDTRAQSLNARATGLGGFAAIIVALLVPAARDLGDPQASDPGTASVVLLAAAAILLVAAALGVLLGVVATRQVRTISIAEIRLWETLAFVSKPPTWVRGRLLVTLRKALVSERLANNLKARWLTAAATLVAAGVLCAAAGGLTLLV